MQSKVNVPWTEAKAAQLIQLVDAIIKKHQDEGVNSPLKGSLVAEMSFKNNAAKQKHQGRHALHEDSIGCFSGKGLVVRYFVSAKRLAYQFSSVSY